MSYSQFHKASADLSRDQQKQKWTQQDTLESGCLRYCLLMDNKSTFTYLEVYPHPKESNRFTIKLFSDDHDNYTASIKAVAALLNSKDQRKNASIMGWDRHADGDSKDPYVRLDSNDASKLNAFIDAIEKVLTMNVKVELKSLIGLKETEEYKRDNTTSFSAT